MFNAWMGGPALRYLVDDRAFSIQPLNGDAGDADGASVSWFDEHGFRTLSKWWTQASWQRKHSYQFNWLGQPIIQLPTDVLMMQEIIWRTKPSLIIETGIAHGGSALFHASLLRLIHDLTAGAAASPPPRVVAIDIEIRSSNQAALDAHPLRPMLTLIEGSSIDPAVVARVRDLRRDGDRVMVVLDSDHSRDHVRAELDAYAPMVAPGCALVAMDGVMPLLANLPAGEPRWEHDHPGLAVQAFLDTPLGREFRIDRRFDGYALTHSPGGVLMRVEAASA